MEQKDYAREIARLENELNNIDSNTKTISEPINEPKKSGIKIYIPYVLMGVASFIFLFLVKPKAILRININNDKPQMVIDRTKLIIWWLILIVFSSIIYVIWTRFRRRSDRN